MRLLFSVFLVVLEMACCYNLGDFHNLRLCFAWIIALSRESCSLNLMYCFTVFSPPAAFLFLNFMSLPSWNGRECSILQGFFGISCLMIPNDIVDLFFILFWRLAVGAHSYLLSTTLVLYSELSKQVKSPWSAPHVKLGQLRLWHSI